MTKRMSADDWGLLRAKWEADPREGFVWLISENNLAVSREAVRQRAGKENWTKAASLKTIVEMAQIKADRGKYKTKLDGKLDGAPPQKLDASSSETLPKTEESVDLRAEVIEAHRKEWESHRQNFPLGDMAGAEEGLDCARRAKTSAEAIRIRQEGERKAWGLDAAESDPNAGMKTLAELDAMFLRASKQAEEMKQTVAHRA